MKKNKILNVDEEFLDELQKSNKIKWLPSITMTQEEYDEKFKNSKCVDIKDIKSIEDFKNLFY